MNMFNNYKATYQFLLTNFDSHEAACQSFNKFVNYSRQFIIACQHLLNKFENKKLQNAKYRRALVEGRSVLVTDLKLFII